MRFVFMILIVPLLLCSCGKKPNLLETPSAPDQAELQQAR